MTQQSMAEQADRERDSKLRDEALEAQNERDRKTEEYLGADEFVLIAPYAQVKVKDDAGTPVVKQFNEGATFKAEAVDEDNLRHLVDIRFLVPKDADEARFAGPAGTPKPGEPPNVPVVEGTPVEMLPHEERLARQREAASKADETDSGSRRGRPAKATTSDKSGN